MELGFLGFHSWQCLAKIMPLIRKIIIEYKCHANIDFAKFKIFIFQQPMPLGS